MATDEQLALSILRTCALDDMGGHAFLIQRFDDGTGGQAFLDTGWKTLNPDEIDLLERLTKEAS